MMQARSPVRSLRSSSSPLILSPGSEGQLPLLFLPGLEAPLLMIRPFVRPALAMASLVLLAGLGVACSSGAKHQASADAPASKPEAAQSAAESNGDQEHGPAEFTLKNGTNSPITEFYVSPPSEDTWEHNLVPDGSEVKPGTQAKVTIDDGRPDCKYDIKAVFGPAADGSSGSGSLVESNVEICDGTTYTYTGG